MTRILYHLGMPKTGTSLLQATMAIADNALRAEAVLYPRAGRVGIAHHALALAVRDQDPANRSAFLADLAAEITATRTKGHDVRVALISSEGLMNLSGARMASGFAEFMSNPGPGLHGTGIIFLREVTSFLESMYLQTTRFRSFDRSFEAYLAPRPKWMQGLLAGLNIVKARMGDAFEIKLAAKGYDVLRAFETVLALPDRFLDEPSGRVGPTERPTLKRQIAMVHLNWIETEVGFKINRKALSHRLLAGDVFVDDVTSFTIYAPGQRARLAASLIPVMQEAGFADYAEMTRALPPSTQPYHGIDRTALTSADIAALAALRDTIEDRPQIDGAARTARPRMKRATD